MYYETKDLNLCVVIVSFTGDVAEIRKTYFSAGLLSKKYPVLVVIPDGKTVDLEELNITDLPVMNGGNCVTSLFDTGIENCLGDWAYMVFAGTSLRKDMDLKLSRYADHESDVLFPVVDRIWNFVDGSMNGILINKNFFQSVGEFGSGNPLKLTKLIWADKAMAKGCKFKAIVGAIIL
jgi:hypothetical protein